MPRGQAQPTLGVPCPPEIRMAAIPNIETILLSIHQALGCPAPKKKRELKDMKRPFEIHQRELKELVDDVLVEAGLDGSKALDARTNLKAFVHFHKTLEVKTWTFGAEFRQVLWDLLACVYVPGLARHAALRIPAYRDRPFRHRDRRIPDDCDRAFRRIVTGRFGNVTDHFGDRDRRLGASFRRCVEI